jgi:XTP/dITP diphosphohydrolase
MKAAFLIATRNAHKVDEIRTILGPDFEYLTLNDFPGAPKVVEDAPTFAGNATKKAVELARWISGMRNAERGTRNRKPETTENAERGTRNAESETNRKVFVLADDSGLEVDALIGAPGVHSARFAALDQAGGDVSENSPDAANNAKLLRLLKDVPPEKRSARFRCVIAVVPVRETESQIESASPVCSADEFEVQTELFDGACEGSIGFAPGGKSGFGYDPLFTPAGFNQTFAELGEETKNRLSHRAKALEKLKVVVGSRIRC